jgi:hypothetical protein
MNFRISICLEGSMRDYPNSDDAVRAFLDYLDIDDCSVEEIPETSAPQQSGEANGL